MPGRGVSRFVKVKRLKRVIVASCHPKVVEWLQPDWSYNTDTGVMEGSFSSVCPRIRCTMSGTHTLFMEEHAPETWPKRKKHLVLNAAEVVMAKLAVSQAKLALSIDKDSDHEGGDSESDDDCREIQPHAAQPARVRRREGGMDTGDRNRGRERARGIKGAATNASRLAAQARNATVKALATANARLQRENESLRRQLALGCRETNADAGVVGTPNSDSTHVDEGERHTLSDREGASSPLGAGKDRMGAAQAYVAPNDAGIGGKSGGERPLVTLKDLRSRPRMSPDLDFDPSVLEIVVSFALFKLGSVSWTEFENAGRLFVFVMIVQVHQHRSSSNLRGARAHQMETAKPGVWELFQTEHYKPDGIKVGP